MLYHSKFKKLVAVLSLFSMLMLGGCSTFSDYTVNGIPVKAMYAESGQQATDADVNNDSSFCGEHRKFCALLFLLAGGIAYAIQYDSKDRSVAPVATPAPVPTPAPTPAPAPPCGCA